MRKRLSVILLAIMVLLCSINSSSLACEENQTNTYVTQILFGDYALSHSGDEKVKMLLSALYLCCEQSDGQGQDKIDYLKNKRVSSVPALSSLDIKSSALFECSHNSWELEYSEFPRIKNSRKKVLQNTVNKVFDFGLFNNWFGSRSGKCNSFAAMLYYAHLLSDYLADDPAETEINVGGRLVPSYSGQPTTVINGNVPSFTYIQKKSTTAFINYSALDGLGRAGTVFANIGPETVEAVGPRQSMNKIKPSGWNFNRYDEIVNSKPAYVYNRCHLLAHSLGGKDQDINLVTGTRYLNETGMKPLENKVKEYIQSTKNHVLYRVTPVFKGDNLLVSGVQIEAYSIEDEGKGICFNIYCYNVQPGIDLNYANGENELSDKTIGAKGVLPFAVYNANDDNPDLIFEMNKHLAILFADQKNSGAYSYMMSEIDSIANQARAVGNPGETAAQCYIRLKEFEYRYFNVIKTYVPVLLQKEEFFSKAFN